MRPGKMVNPSALISVSAPGRSLPTAWMVSLSMAISALSAPDSVTTVPPRMTRSAGIEGLHFLEECEAGSERGCDIFLADGLIGVMADAAGTAQEQHGDRHFPRDDHGVVSSSAVHAVRRIAVGDHCGFESRGEPGVGGDGGLVDSIFD